MDATGDLTDCQREIIEKLATRYGCWPHDTDIVLTGRIADVTFGTAKGRPKHILIEPEGRVRRAP